MCGRVLYRIVFSVCSCLPATIAEPQCVIVICVSAFKVLVSVFFCFFSQLRLCQVLLCADSLFACCVCMSDFGFCFVPQPRLSFDFSFRRSRLDSTHFHITPSPSSSPQTFSIPCCSPFDRGHTSTCNSFGPNYASIPAVAATKPFTAFLSHINHNVGPARHVASTRQLQGKGRLQAG